ncbi:MAG: YraN family protein [Chitinophagaceae bacterium]
MNNKKTGQEGELLAQQFLKEQGYEILNINWRTGHKEIDIICKQQDVYIFVEVKTRLHTRMGMPEESVSEKKIQAVTEAARIYLEDKVYSDIRFDVISIILQKNNQHDILHIKDAFY